MSPEPECKPNFILVYTRFRAVKSPGKESNPQPCGPKPHALSS